MTDPTPAARTRKAKTEPAVEAVAEAPADPAPLEHASIVAALVAFQAEMPVVVKNHTAKVRSDSGGYEYKYADLADVTAAALPLLTRHGLAFVCAPRRTVEFGLELVGTLHHVSGGTLEGSLPLPGGTAQALGSSITYMRRYLLGTLTGIVTDDDDDGQAGSAPAVPNAAQRAATEASAARQVEHANLLRARDHYLPMIRRVVTETEPEDETRKERLTLLWQNAGGDGVIDQLVPVPPEWEVARPGATGLLRDVFAAAATAVDQSPRPPAPEVERRTDAPAGEWDVTGQETQP